MIRIECESSGHVRTVGLVGAAGFDLQIPGVAIDLRDAAGNLLRSLAAYFSIGPKSLEPRETIDWASSLLVARRVRAQLFELDEVGFDGTLVIEGATNAIRLWAEQSAVCNSKSAILQPCRFGHTIAVSPGVLQSTGRLEGMRYPPSGSASGWWIFTPEYDGQLDDFSSMQLTHTFHVLRYRRDIGRYLGLPPGFAFDTDSQDHIWFESEVAATSREDNAVPTIRKDN